ncbi:hypothetical protein PVL29_025127 [Vitis rotundifolia]|uniref:Retrotransposon Copia-like N-terminal domain-containing protein n=1 Tax=Vitis rotundifolia TaxID=103349 RepID=A0AA38YTK8_VITRO|nr:hypothetical protein PVL29_025127 [Vitis rotundifolia]
MARGNHSYAHIVVGSSDPLPIEDSNSPFYFHNGDHTRLILGSHHLSRSNYNTWSRAMMIVNDEEQARIRPWLHFSPCFR